MEAKIKKACKVIATLSKLVIELISLAGWLYFLKIAIAQLLS